MTAKERMKLRSRRENLGLSQEGFARRIGVRLITISRWENGTTTPSEENEKRWRRALDRLEAKEDKDARTVV